MSKSEMVLCVNRGMAIGIAPLSRGFTAWSIPGRSHDVVFNHMLATACYRERTAALEANEFIKQVISYVIIEDPIHHLILSYCRAGAEGRLDDRLSIGLGGHLNPRDGAHLGFPGFLSGMLRELVEELNQDFVIESFRMVGFLNDNSDPVGRVHLGVAVHAMVPGIDLGRCREGRTWQWQSRVVLGSHQPGILESWSQLLIDGGILR